MRVNWVLKYAILFSLLIVVGVIVPPKSLADLGPKPGDIYREYILKPGGNNWRVTDPDASQSGAQDFLPNPVLDFSIDDLQGALRAEVIMDRWGGHTGTSNKQIRFNGNSWIDLPELATTPSGHHPECYMYEDNVMVEVPLSHLQTGKNTFEGNSDKQICYSFDWGQWGWYVMIVRIYYDAGKPHPTGYISSPSSGSTIGENPEVTVSEQSGGGVSQVDVLAYYEGYDENGDGIYRDWHHNYHYDQMSHHVGTDSTSPYEVTWDTTWVPDQPANGLKFIARIKDTDGIWYVTSPVQNISLVRTDYSVKMYKPYDVPESFWVRVGATKSSKVHIPSEHILSDAIEAAVHLRTWNGYKENFKLNSWSGSISGSDHNFAYTIRDVPISALRNGENVIEFHSTTTHHGPEIHWPGPGLTVRYAGGEPPPDPDPPTFEHKVIDSSGKGRVAIGDINGDGYNDVALHTWGEDISWYRYPDWERHIIASNSGIKGDEITIVDLDADGDNDIVGAYNNSGKNVYWFENPGGSATSGWKEHFVGNGLAEMKDVHVTDLDGDGKLDVVTRHHSNIFIFFQENPTSWTSRQIKIREREGMDIGDLDSDGDVDIVLNGFWLENPSDARTATWTEHSIDDMWYSGQSIGWRNYACRVQVIDINRDGRMDVVYSHAEAHQGNWPIAWYESSNPKGGDSAWQRHDIGYQLNCHTLQVADMDSDGDYDVVAGRLRDDTYLPLYVFFNHGDALNWDRVEIDDTGCYSGKVGDIDNDGDLDFVSSMRWDSGPVYLMRNTLDSGPIILPLDSWERHVVDSGKPWRAVFIDSADMDGDGLKDIVTGGWWYRNPGHPDGSWTRQTIGSPLNNMAAVYDFDDDGDLDVLGTQGQGASTNSNFVWARNSGAGYFSIHSNVQSGDGDFLQGVVVAPFQGSDSKEVALSWHAAGKGIQMLTVPADPSSDTWTRRQVSATSQDEDLSVGDIDRDGDFDLLLGTKWLRNEGSAWGVFALNGTTGSPDRNRLADIDGDGRLDAVVGFEAISKSGKLAWYKQPSSVTSTWVEHVIANVIGPMSLDVVDMDSDGDIDVVVGEHNLSDSSTAKLYVFENWNGQGTSWSQHVVYTGDEHHDGAQTVDIDNDGDLDIISIGWSHGKVLLYENKAISGGQVVPSPPSARLTATPTTGDLPLSVSFDASGSSDAGGSISSYHWDFDDGATANGVMVSHTYNTSGNYTVTLTVTDNDGATDSATVNIVVYPVGGTPAFPDTMAHWKMDEGSGTTAADESGSGHNGTVSGASWTSGKIKGALRFDGSNDYVDVGNFDINESELSISMWFQADRFDHLTAHDARLISKATGTAEGDHYWMLSTIKDGNNTRLRFRLKTNGVTKTLIASSGNLAAGQWVHAAVVYDGSRMKLYKDGVEVGTTSKDGWISSGPEVPVWIGRNPRGERPWDGLIDDVRIYDVALNHEQIQELASGSPSPGKTAPAAPGGLRIKR